MKILGIRNRTENWKTARLFSPLFGEESICLAKCLGEQTETRPGDVHLELYWKGMRDYLHKLRNAGKDNPHDSHDFAKRYTCLFPDLRARIQEFGQFQPLRDKNYDVRPEDEEGMADLRNNLVNTEIDIVLETPGHLFIGEAKHEMSFHADGRQTLVHQLIRQYVMATILIDCIGSGKQVVPFVVGDTREGLKRKTQVKFMIQQDWMKAENVLEWGEIKKLGLRR